MKITLKVKRLSNPNRIIAQSQYETDLKFCTLKQLIEFFVREEVRKYNSHTENNIAWLYESEEEIQQQVSLGKIGFGYKNIENKADEKKAVEVALQAIEDGLVRIFINDEEIPGLNQKIELHEKDEIIFFRFTFITGRFF